MDGTMSIVGSAIIGIFVGGILVWYSLKKRQEKYAFKVVKDAQEESQNILKQAKVEAENIKKEKIYQAKEKFLELKAEHEKLILAKERKSQKQKNALKTRNLKSPMSWRRTKSSMKNSLRKIKNANTAFPLWIKSKRKWTDCTKAKRNNSKSSLDLQPKRLKHN